MIYLLKYRTGKPEAQVLAVFQTREEAYAEKSARPFDGLLVWCPATQELTYARGDWVSKRLIKYPFDSHGLGRR